MAYIEPLSAASDKLLYTAPRRKWEFVGLSAASKLGQPKPVQKPSDELLSCAKLWSAGAAYKQAYTPMGALPQWIPSSL